MVEKRSCTAIVCAYNEEHTVGGVLLALLESPLVDEIVVVDDGSRDRTFSIVSSFEKWGVRAIRLPRNRGKGFAMAEGIAAARGGVLAFVDADLINLSPDYVAEFALPVLEGRADMVIGYPRRHKSTAFPDPTIMLSGERALRRHDILPIVPIMKDSRFGVETIINLHYRREGKSVLYVPLEGLVHPLKVEKTDLTSALGLYTRELSEIAMAMARNYPLALAAFGLDPRRPQAWMYRMGERFSPPGMVAWPRQVSGVAQQTLRSLKRFPLSAMDYIGVYDPSTGLIDDDDNANHTH